MKKVPYIVMMLSDKGGVGKTTVAVNLAVALRGYGFRVLLIESDMFNPSIAFHLDIEARKHDFIDYAEGRCALRDAIVTHGPSSLDVLPCAINKNPIALRKAIAESFMSDLIKRSGYDFIVIDTEPGRFENELANYVDEAILIATPDIPSVVSVIRLGVIFARHRVKSGVLINMRRNKGYELGRDEIEEVSENSVIDELPYTDLVPVSINKHIPAVLLNRNSKFSKEMRWLAEMYASASGLSGEIQKTGVVGTIIGRLEGRDVARSRGKVLEEVRQVAEDEEQYEEEKARREGAPLERRAAAEARRASQKRGETLRQMVKTEIGREKRALAKGARGAAMATSVVTEHGEMIQHMVKTGVRQNRKALARSAEKAGSIMTEQGEIVRQMVKKGVRQNRKTLARGAGNVGRKGYEGAEKAVGAMAESSGIIRQQVEKGIAYEKKVLAKEQRKRARRSRKVVHVKL